MPKALVLEEVHIDNCCDEEEYLVLFQDEDGQPVFEICMYHYDGKNSSWVNSRCEPYNIHPVGEEETIFEAPENGTIESDEIERSDEDIIEDGFGSAWSIICPDCGERSMEVVRPGKVQCGNCG